MYCEPGRGFLEAGGAGLAVRIRFGVGFWGRI
jgi:hypothetical protein